MTKRVGLFSIPNYFNYGTQLQLYSLQTAIERAGYFCSVINYVMAPLSSVAVTNRLENILRHPYRVPVGLVRRAYRRYVMTRNRRQVALFQDFQKKYIKLSGAVFSSPEELLSAPPVFDAYVVGSDQVWSPLGHLGDNAFFLEFADPGKRIAYAPSLGVEVIPADAIEWLREGVAGIDHLSVRELTGARLIMTHFEREAEVVVDPTLLLTADDWRRVKQSTIVPNDFILQYTLCGDRYIRVHADKIAKELGIPLVVLPKHPRDILSASRNKILLYDVGPREFVDLVSNARLVLTDSFHGTVFSVIFNRPFFSFRRYDDSVQSATFSRIADFLGKLGLQGRIMNHESAQDLQSLDVSYLEVRPLLEDWISQSRVFLANALKCATMSRDR